MISNGAIWYHATAMSDTPTTTLNDAAPANPVLALAPEEEPKLPTEPTALAVRLWSGLIFSIAGGMLIVGAFLTPSADGFGKNHGLFGMPPCGFYQATGYPCPTCGCTTAVSHFAHGHILTSFLTQPFGFSVALVATIASAFAIAGVLTGKWYGPSAFVLGWYWRLWVFGGIGLLAIGWVYKCIVVRMGA